MAGSAIPLNSNLSLHRLTLRFSREKLEREFQVEYLNKSRKPLQYLFLAGIFIYLLQIVRDWTYDQPWTYFIEYAMVTPTLAVNLILTLSPRGRSLLPYGIVLSIAMISVGNIMVTAMVPENPIYLITSYVSLIFCVYTVARLHLMFAMTAALLITSVYVASAALVFHLSAEAIAYQGMPLMIANIVGFIAGYTIEYHLRKEFHVQKELAAANRELDDANQLKTEFLGIAAHDLRNPLTAVQGYAEMMLADETLSDAHRQDLDVIRTSSERMNHIITQLMEIVRLETGPIETKVALTDFSRIAAGIADSYRHLALKKNQRLSVEVEPSVMVKGDEIQLRSVVDNLVSNAVKYTPHDKSIVVKLVSQDRSAHLEIIDEGPGFAPEDFGKLFNKFQRFRATPTDGETSTGLGLSIAKKFTDLHHGRIMVENRSDGPGAKVVVELDLVPPQSA